MAYKDIYTTKSFDHLWELDDDTTDSIGTLNGSAGAPDAYVNSIVPEASGSYNCGDFRATSTGVTIPNDASINTATTYEKTMSFWIYLDDVSSTTNGGRPIWTEGGGTNGLSIYTYDSDLYFHIYESSLLDTLSFAVSASTLYHIVCVMDCNADFTKLYANGELVDSKTSLNIGSDFAAHSAGIKLGGGQGSVKNHLGTAITNTMDGRLADFAYKAEDTVLTLSDVQDVYVAGGGVLPGGSLFDAAGNV